MKAALYARVSTKDKGQDPENQLLPMREECKRRGWTIHQEYVEHQSGSGSKSRHVFDSMMRAADDKQFDVVMFWSLDRFTREGVLKTLDHLQRLTRAEVGWVSIQEQFLDSVSLGPMRDAVVGIIAALAQMETQRRSERAKAAVANKRSKGEHVGRERKNISERRLRQLIQEGYSIVRTAKELNCSPGTVYNRIRELGL